MVVRWSSKLSLTFPCSNGIKQGGVLSPTLFCVYIDVLICRIASSKIGCYVGHEYVGALGYADDLALLAPTVAAAKQLLNICESFANEYSVLFNGTKSVCIVTGMRANVRVELKLNGEVIPCKDNATHLGTVIGPNSSVLNVKQAVADLYKATNLLMSNFGHCSINVLDVLFSSYCTAFYGSPLWKLNVHTMRPLVTAWKKCLKRVWKLSVRTRSHYVALLRDLDLIPMLLLRYFNFYVRCIESNNRIVRYMAELSECPNLKICSEVSSLDVDVLYGNRNFVRQCIRNITVNNSSPEIVALAGVLRELCYCRDGIFNT